MTDNNEGIEPTVVDTLVNFRDPSTYTPEDRIHLVTALMAEKNKDVYDMILFSLLCAPATQADRIAAATLKPLALVKLFKEDYIAKQQGKHD